ncbi:MAG: RidA family protein [Rhodospirillales bacterium]
MLTVHTLNDRIGAHREGAGHATEVPPNSRLLFCNGQVGCLPDGTVPGDVGEQVTIALDRIAAILAAADMGFEDIVKVTIYVTAPKHLDHFYAQRKTYFADHNPPAVLLTVGPFPRPGVQIEIEVTAAKAA